MKTLITGGGGFIGTHLTQRLVEAGHGCRILDCHPPSHEPPQDGVAYIQGDVRDLDAVREASEGCDTVLHLAAAHHDAGIADATFADVNEHGTGIVCDVASELGIQQLCFYSSVAVYGDAGPPRDESTSPRPTTPYGQSKLGGEAVVAAWARGDAGRRALILRPTAVVGPGHYANMFTLTRQIESGRFLPVGRGDNRKSLCHVANLVEATLFLLDAPPAADEDGVSVLNIVDKPDLASRDIIATLYEALGKRPPRLYVPYVLARLAAVPLDLVAHALRRDFGISGARIRKLACDETTFDAAALAAAGFHPRVPLRQGLTDYVAWYRAHAADDRPAPRLPPPARAER